jgi:hypothetical protein
MMIFQRISQPRLQGFQQLNLLVDGVTASNRQTDRHMHTHTVTHCGVYTVNSIRCRFLGLDTQLPLIGLFNVQEGDSVSISHVTAKSCQASMAKFCLL